jgi:hypothetical protein
MHNTDGQVFLMNMPSVMTNVLVLSGLADDHAITSVPANPPLRQPHLKVEYNPTYKTSFETIVLQFTYINHSMIGMREGHSASLSVGRWNSWVYLLEI